MFLLKHDLQQRDDTELANVQDFAQLTRSHPLAADGQGPPFGTVKTQRKSFNKDMSIGIDCLMRTQTEVLKGFVAQAKRTCLTLSDNSFALQAFNQECFPFRSSFKNSELGQTTVERRPSERWTPISNRRPVTFEIS
jgi:hypothetical protein